LREQYSRLFAVCRRLTGNEADAADATQEALIALSRGLANFRGASQFGTWAYRVAVNASFDELRRRKRRPDPDPEVTMAADTRMDPVADCVDRVDIDVALRRLPHDFRAAVVLRDLCGLDYEEIASVLEIPIGTVRSRIARGRSALARVLAGNSPATPDRPKA
jgi:RNA polymerase sigma-70 factor (ECF subfamily)